MTISNYDYGFPNGVSIRNMPVELLLSPLSNVYWVDSNKGSDGNAGNFKYPFATLDYAVSRCKDNNGDHIFVAAGHHEIVSVSEGLTINKSGITIEFLGVGSSRGSIDFTTSTAASVLISGDNLTFRNPRFTCYVDTLIEAINITSKDVTILNGLYVDLDNVGTTDCIVAADTASGLVIDGWKYAYGTPPIISQKTGIKLYGGAYTTLKNIDIAGIFSQANINNATTECLALRLENIFVHNLDPTPNPGIILQANSTGMAKNVDVRIDSGTTFVSTVAKLNWDARCLGYNTDGESGTPIAVYTP